jgi:hypothetical protein
MRDNRDERAALDVAAIRRMARMRVDRSLLNVDKTAERQPFGHA